MHASQAVMHSQNNVCCKPYSQS